MIDFKKLLPGQPTNGEEQETVTLSGNKKEAENQLIMRIMQGLDILHDQEGVYYLGDNRVYNGIKRYRIDPIDPSIANRLYFGALNLTAGAISADFGKKCLSYIAGALHEEDDVFKRKKGVIVGSRVAQDGPAPTEACHLNIGEPETGEPMSIKITADAVVTLRLEVGGEWADVAEFVARDRELTYREVWFTR